MKVLIKQHGLTKRDDACVTAILISFIIILLAYYFFLLKCAIRRQIVKVPGLSTYFLLIKHSLQLSS